MPEVTDMQSGATAAVHRTIVVGLVWSRRGELLFCRMSPDRGVFPGQWGFPGGGIEPGETMRAALRRELREELGVEVVDIRPAFFKDCRHDKTFADGTVRPVYMVFLLFHCTAQEEELTLNDEFVDYRWVSESEVARLDLNEETVDTLQRLGPWPAGATAGPGPAPQQVAFDDLDWESPMEGLRFKASLHGDRRLRLVEYTPEMEGHWCEAGHTGYVLEGRLEVRFPGGKTVFGPADGIVIPPGPEHRHMGRALTEVVRVVFVEDV